MKFTPQQEAEMESLKAEVSELLKKHGKTRSMRNLQFDILNLKEKFETLKNFKVSYGWIGKQKRRVLKPRPKSIVKEVAGRNLLEWLRKRKANPLTALVTTSQVRSKWKHFFAREPSRYALKIFRDTNGLQVVFDKRTKNTNSWVFTS